MKKILGFTFILGVFLFFGCESSPPLPKLSLENVIDTGLDIGIRHFGMSINGDFLYLTGYNDNEVTKLSLLDNTVESGFPLHVSDVSNPHGLYADEDGSIWIADLNNDRINHYSSDFTNNVSKTIGSQPVNLISSTDKLYVGDRWDDKLYILNKTDLTLFGKFDIPGMILDEGNDYIDLFIYDGDIYIVSNELAGIVVMTIDGVYKKTIILAGFNSLNAIGIYVIHDYIYVQNSNFLIKADLTGTIVDQCEIVSPEGFSGTYIDLEIYNEKIYIASHNYKVDDTKAPHVLVYGEN